MICHNLSTFWKPLGKKMLFWVKTVFLGQKVHKLLILLNLICTFAFTRKNGAFVEKFTNFFTPSLREAF